MKLPTIQYLTDTTNHNIQSPPAREKLKAINAGQSNPQAATLGYLSSARSDCCDDYVPEDEQSAIVALLELDNPFDAFHPTLTGPEVTHDGPETCLLFTLPRELRDMIYIHLAAAGHLKLAQVSKRCAREFMEVVEKWGICRLKLDKWHRPSYPRHSKLLGRTVQHLDILIAVPKSEAFLIKYFSNAMIPRKTCRVVIHSRCLFSPNGMYRSSRALSFLGGFQYLTIESKGPKISLRLVEHGIDECEELGGRLRKSLGDYALKRNDQGST